MTTRRLRPGNGALDYLLANFAGRSENLEKLVTRLPELAAILSEDARNTAKILLKKQDIRERIRAMLASSSEKLAYCIFDLMLVPCFEEIEQYSGNNEFASVFLDALLYEVTGHEPETPTELQVRDEGTQDVRGITKYRVGRIHITGIGDTEGWMFGKEYSAIATGRAKDIIRVMAVQPFTLLIRQHTRWAVKYFLHGTLPSDEEQQRLNSVVSDFYERLNATLAPVEPHSS